MGHKVNPVGMRLQVNRTWDSRWYADTKEYGDLLLEDIKIREFIKEECKQAGISRVIIERPHKKCRVTVHTARPGVIIGKKGADIEGLRKKLAEITDSELHLNIVEVRKPELDAALVAEGIAQQLERRVSFRRAMKRACRTRCAWARLVFASTLRVVLAVLRLRGPNGIAKVACRCTRCAPISTMHWPRRRRLMVSSGSRSGSSKARSWNTIRRHMIVVSRNCRRAQVLVGPAAVVAGTRS